MKLRELVKEARKVYGKDLLLFKVGDYYEAYGKDAEDMSNLLGLRLTGDGEKAFVGVVAKKVHKYIKQLLFKGLRLYTIDPVDDSGEYSLDKQYVKFFNSIGLKDRYDVLKESIPKLENKYLLAMRDEEVYIVYDNKEYKFMKEFEEEFDENGDKFFVVKSLNALMNICEYKGINVVVSKQIKYENRKRIDVIDIIIIN